jgi:hypothetical protein
MEGWQGLDHFLLSAASILSTISISDLSREFATSLLSALTLYDVRITVRPSGNNGTQKIGLVSRARSHIPSRLPSTERPWALILNNLRKSAWKSLYSSSVIMFMTTLEIEKKNMYPPARSRSSSKVRQPRTKAGLSVFSGSSIHVTAPVPLPIKCLNCVVIGSLTAHQIVTCAGRNTVHRAFCRTSRSIPVIGTPLLSITT